MRRASGPTNSRADIQKTTGTIDDLAQEGLDLNSIVQFLRGNGQLANTLSSDLCAAAVTVKESAEPTLPLSLARRIEVAIEPGRSEVKRLNA